MRRADEDVWGQINANDSKLGQVMGNESRWSYTIADEDKRGHMKENEGKWRQMKPMKADDST